MKLRPSTFAAIAALLGGLALASGCGDDSPTSGHHHLQPAPDFELADLNSSSPTYQQILSPRDYLGGVSAWYFGHST